MNWPSLKRELQVWMDSDPQIPPPRLTAPRREKGEVILLSGIDRELLEEAGKD